MNVEQTRQSPTTPGSVRRRRPQGWRIATAVVTVGLITGAATVVAKTQTPASPFTNVSRDISVAGDDAPADPAGTNAAAGLPGGIEYGPGGATFGPNNGTSTLLLYDAQGRTAAGAELTATNAAHLAAHFGRVTTQDVARYTAGTMKRHDAVLYLGSRTADILPSAFLRDVRAGATPVIWAGANAEELASGGHARQFRERYGWDAESVTRLEIKPAGVRYKKQVLGRDAAGNPEPVYVPKIRDDTRVDVLAEAMCGPAAALQPCPGADARGGRATTAPWAIRSANLTYIGEVPFSYVRENDRFLIYADLLYDALGKEITPVRQAAVRLEDVSPLSNPDTIREYADYLYDSGVPFSIAVIPRYVDPRGVYHDGVPTSVRLQDAPGLVDALDYAVEKGATLVQHGTTHQFKSVENPYTGVSAEDFEFLRAGCTATPSATTFVPCETDTHVKTVGAVGADSLAGWEARIAEGRDLFTAAGLPAPQIFETPHYAATTTAYAAMRRVYGTRYERIEFSDGLLRNTPTTGKTEGLHFPYSTTDVTGARVIPENLGNFAPESYSGHEKRDVQGLIDNARANLVVRESTASFFFHPFLPKESLAQVVDGIQSLGYTFVRPQELR